MAKATTKPVMAISLIAARLTFAAAAIHLILLAALHIIKPDFDPSWRMVSEYSIGRFGWVMVLAFLSMALSCLYLFVAIRSQIGTNGGKIGLVLILIVAGALTAAAIFKADPMTASKDALTTHGNLHGLASMIGVPGFPIAAMLISISLVRNEAWYSARKSLLWTANLTWISVLLMLITLAITLPMSGGKFGPDVLIGWPNRLEMLVYCVWLMTIAWRANQLRKQSFLTVRSFNIRM
jgi:hypothetical protein